MRGWLRDEAVASPLDPSRALQPLDLFLQHYTTAALPPSAIQEKGIFFLCYIDVQESQQYQLVSLPVQTSSFTFISFLMSRFRSSFEPPLIPLKKSELINKRK